MMAAYEEKRVVPYAAEQMYALVADVRRYPDFLPWCHAAIIHSESAEELCADLTVGMGPLQGTFRSQVHLAPPEQIMVTYQDGPLKHLQNQWTFRAQERGCEIHFFIDFEFKNPLFETMMRTFFQEATRQMMVAFERRARALYGDPL